MFKVGDLVRQELSKELSDFITKEMGGLMSDIEQMQGVVVSIRPVPEDFINVDSKWIIEVLWANGYSNKTSHYYEDDLVLAEDCIER